MKLACILGAGILFTIDSYAQQNITHERASIGIGLSTTSNGTGEFSAEYAVASRWSVSFSGGFKIGTPASLSDKETIAHHEEFGSRTRAAADPRLVHKESISIVFWPAEAYKGISLSLGVEYISHEGLDGIIGVSYRIPIWKMIATDLGYHIRCISPLIYNSRYNGAACIKIHYRF